MATRRSITNLAILAESEAAQEEVKRKTYEKLARNYERMHGIILRGANGI